MEAPKFHQDLRHSRFCPETMSVFCDKKQNTEHMVSRQRIFFFKGFSPSIVFFSSKKGRRFHGKESSPLEAIRELG